MTPDDPLARRAQYFLPREILGYLGIPDDPRLVAICSQYMTDDGPIDTCIPLRPVAGASEKAAIKRQLHNGNQQAEEAAAKRGYKLHPTLHMSFERIGNASLPIAGPAAASTDVPLAAARPRARMGGQSGGPFLEIRDIAFALRDVARVILGLFSIALYVGAVAFAIFILLVAVQ